MFEDEQHRDSNLGFGLKDRAEYRFYRNRHPQLKPPKDSEEICDNPPEIEDLTYPGIKGMRELRNEYQRMYDTQFEFNLRTVQYFLNHYQDDYYTPFRIQKTMCLRSKQHPHMVIITDRENCGLLLFHSEDLVFASKLNKSPG
jgi:hypothetical protein